MIDKSKRMMLFCDSCNYKKILSPEAKSDLPEVKTSPVQVTLPNIDPVTKKVIAARFKDQQKKFKCPVCGKTIKVRELLKPYVDLFKQLDQEKERQRIEEDKKKRIEDGKPIERAADSLNHEPK